MVKLANIVVYISMFSVLIPIIFLVSKKQNLQIFIIRILGILLFASAFSDFGCYIIFKLGKSNNLLNNAYIITQFFLLSYLYYLLLESKKIIYIGLILFLVFSIVNIFFIQSIGLFQNWILFLEAVIFIGYSMGYYIQLLQNIPAISIFRFSNFWLNTAVFYYFGASFLIFLCTNYIMSTQSAETGLIVWGFHNLNNIIKNILFAIAIYYASAKEETVN